MTKSRGEAGFTLIEVIISLALFALIAVAGVAMVEGVLRVQGQTNGRLERLGDIQRAMFVVANDLGQTAGGPVVGVQTGISFNRRFSAGGGEARTVAYRFERSMLIRDIGPIGRQRMLDGVSSISWRYYDEVTGWLDHWPPDPKQPGAWPEAVSLDVVLQPSLNRPSGTLRRVVALPMKP